MFYITSKLYRLITNLYGSLAVVLYQAIFQILHGPRLIKNPTFVMGASSGSPCSLASDVRRKPSDAIERTSSDPRRMEWSEPRPRSFSIACVGSHTNTMCDVLLGDRH